MIAVKTYPSIISVSLMTDNSSESRSPRWLLSLMFADPQRTSPGYQPRLRCSWTLQEVVKRRLTIINDTGLSVDVNLFSRENTRFMFTPSSQREESHVLLGLFVSTTPYFGMMDRRTCYARPPPQTHINTLLPQPRENTSAPSTNSPILTFHNQPNTTSLSTINRVRIPR